MFETHPSNTRGKYWVAYYSATDIGARVKPKLILFNLLFNFSATDHQINVNPKTVFANNEINLSNIDVYGFDYDYTLACYTDHLHYLIYNQAMENLVERKMVNKVLN